MPGLLQIINPVIGLAINIFVQILSFRYIDYLGLLKSVFLGFFCGLISVLVLECYIYIHWSLSLNSFLSILLANFIIYSSLGYCYFHLINLGETGRRVRILRELYDSEEGLSMKEIFGLYDCKKIVEVRINRLVNNGQIVCRQGRYYVGKRFTLILAKIIVTMKLIVLGGKSEFDWSQDIS